MTIFNVGDRVTIVPGSRYERGTSHNPHSDVVGVVVSAGEYRVHRLDPHNIRVSWPDNGHNCYNSSDLRHAPRERINGRPVPRTAHYVSRSGRAYYKPSASGGVLYLERGSNTWKRFRNSVRWGSFLSENRSCLRPVNGHSPIPSPVKPFNVEDLL